ncbi:hypothetical protein [Streptomyces cellulosae]|uniref:Uncharacterized protein n=1 Tax=Streptomyces cellulosae TaxID=1968 RepID=A0ABW7XZV1_STRCE
MAALAVIVPNDAGATAVMPVVLAAARGISRALGAPDLGTTPGPEWLMGRQCDGRVTADGSWPA